MKATDFDKLFDDGEEDIMGHLDLKNARHFSSPKVKTRVFGQFRGQIQIADNFDDEFPLANDFAGEKTLIDDITNSHENGFVTVMVEFDRDVLEAFRAMGADWQHRMNVALKQWLQQHSLAHSV